MGHDYATRTKRIRSLLAEAGIDALVASVGADLPYLTGYEALPHRTAHHAGAPG